jgi:uncharacterized protein (TIGR03437 family)
MQQGLDRRVGRMLLATLVALPATAISGPASMIAHVPNVQIKAAKVDLLGNIYLAGQTATGAASSAAWIAKLSADGATTFYAVTIGSSGYTTANVLDIDSAGAVYVAGTTTASDFPVTAGAVQSAAATAFAVKLDGKGNIVYSASIGGNAQTVPSSIAVNSKKELVISGQSTTRTSSSAVTALFVLKLSADGTQTTAGQQGVGGLLAIDAQDNIYVAGVPPTLSTDPQATPGAFQGAPPTFFCGCPFLNFPCGGDQFVASLAPDLSRTRFLTYVTAKFGAVPALIGLDAHGDVLVAGSTAAPGYPTTQGSYQPNYSAASRTVLTCGPPIPMEVTSPSGYVTLVKADGSGLVFSTFFSGSKTDRITFGALTSAGIYLGGQAGSVDLPGFDGAVPSPCLPVGFLARMALDGSTISASRTPPGTPVAYDSTTGTLLLVSGSDLLRFDPSAPTPIACVLDAADLSPVTAVAPGELLTMFGRFQYFDANPSFAANAPAIGISPVNGSFPVTSEGLGVLANEIPAPLLYISGQQVNFQAPYEIAGGSQTDVTVTYSDVNGHKVSDSRTLEVTASNPVAFLSQPSIVNQSFPLALNADGSANSQANPAAAESIVTILLDGLGVTSPAPVTGLVTSSSVPLNLAVMVAPACDGGFCYPAPAFVSAGSVPGSISGITQVQLQAPANPNHGSAFQSIFSLAVNSTTVRDLSLSFWVK